MDDNSIDSKFRDFSNYLLDIGFLSGATYTDFGKIFKEIKKNNILYSENEEGDKDNDLILKDNVSKAIVEFYKSMNDEKKLLHAMNIFTKYSSKKKDEEAKKNIFQSVYSINNDEIIEENIDNKKNIEYSIVHIDSFNILATNNNKQKNKKIKMGMVKMKKIKIIAHLIILWCKKIKKIKML
jgi:hypothetical protein